MERGRDIAADTSAPAPVQLPYAPSTDDSALLAPADGPVGRRWANLPLRFKGMVMIAVPLPALVLAAVSFYLAGQHDRQTRAWLVNNHQLDAGIHAISSQILTADNAVRTWLLTGRQSSLEPYRQSQKSIPELLTRLEGVAPEQAREIRSLVEQELAVLSKLRISGDRGLLAREAALEDTVAEKLSGIEREQDGMLARTIEESDRSHTFYLAFAVMNAFLGVLAGFIVALIFAADIVARVDRVRENAARLAKSQSLIPARAGGDEIGRLARALEAASMVQAARETELRSSEARFRELFENANDVIYTLDLNSNFTSINKAGERLLGYSRSEVLAMNLAQLMPDSGHQLFSQMLERKLGGEPLTSYEMELRARDGRQLMLEVSTRLLFQNGKPVGVQGMGRDTTKRKQAEQALRDSEEKYRSLFENVLEGVYQSTPAGQLVTANSALVDMLGYSSRTELLQIDIAKDLYVSPEGRKSNLQVLETQGSLRNTELVLKRKDGRLITALENSRVVRNEAGEILYYEGTLTDITERKQAEQALARQALELARSNADLEQFAYVASHDLQEPLRMVASYTQLLARRYKGQLDGDADEFISYAVEGVTRMRQLIQDLLAYSRLSVRGDAFRATDFGAVLTQALGDLRAAIAESGAVIERDPLPTLTADAFQITQIFQNLIGNAIKFRGQEPLHIHVSADRQNNEWVFEIRDNGIGVEPEYLERIFVIFQRLHSKALYPGTGIGLAICKKIVERHGGRIWAESEPGKGSSFYFTIPVKGREAV